MVTPADQRPRIEYPCRWEFKVIGLDERVLRRETEEALLSVLGSPAGTEARDYDLSISRTSRGGKYVSLSLALRVEDEAERDAIFTALNECPNIVMVI